MRRAKPDDELITVAEAAEEKGVSQNGIRIAIRAGRLPAVKKTFGYLIRRSDLKAWKPRGWRSKDDERE